MHEEVGYEADDYLPGLGNTSYHGGLSQGSRSCRDAGARTAIA